ncbi:MAG: DNA cytosine methyltransferase [Vulcanimicrobiaceae bacterium]
MRSRHHRRHRDRAHASQRADAKQRQEGILCCVAVLFIGSGIIARLLTTPTPRSPVLRSDRVTRQNRKSADKTRRSGTRNESPACRYIHPSKHRGLSTLEMAALQSFPTDYEFVGKIGSVPRQIGNAVPPRPGEVIGHAIAQHLRARARRAA